MLPNHIRHILFDLDGTLLDSLHLWKNLGHDFLRTHGVTPPADLREHLVRMTLPMTATFFHETLGVLLSPKEILEEMISRITDGYRHTIQPKPYTIEFLKQQQAAGVTMSILTASEASYVQAALKRLDMEQYFVSLMTCTKIGCGKDDPNVFLHACEALGGYPADTAVFEDSLHAMETAKAAGFYVVAVADLHSNGGDFSSYSACYDQAIVSFSELL